jgi:dienelactone hydrolase
VGKALVIVVIVSAVGLVAGVAGTAVAGFPTFPAGCLRSDFHSGGGLVRAELCQGGHRQAPIAIVLHGCGGFSGFDHRLATELPRLGVDTLDVDYFAQTPPPGRRGFCGARHKSANTFTLWLQTVAAAATHLRSLPGGSERHVEVVGWSLGGGLAVASALAGVHFSALAGFSTGAFGITPAKARKLPPTILLSGGSTDAIPLSETLPLYRALRVAHRPSVLYVYPHGSHQWPGRQGTLGIHAAAAFLHRY